ncbi:MAG: DNA cytosine methyltransferase [Cellulomonadaceae bacterium]|nr:DNA cytosine methyltransferase [Cellulomonadaceae bacterium]
MQDRASLVLPEAPTKALTVLDLFAGAGGITTGFHEVGGFATVAAVEFDVAAAATYRANHPGARVHVKAIQDWIKDDGVPSVDVIVGGPPCQGFSTLGKQDVEDERNALWMEYAKTIVKARPKYFVVENVAAFMKSPQYRQFEAACAPGGMLEDYRFQARVLNAADYGAFQARKRAFLIGYRADLDFPGWPEPTHAGRHRTVAEAFARIENEPRTTELPARSTSTPGGGVMPGPFSSTELHVGRDYRPISLARFNAIPAGGNRFDLPDDLKARCWIGHTSGSGDVMGRLHWNKPAVTIRTEFFKPEKGRYLHPERPRAITHFEAALLQGFPQDYRWVGSKTAIARQIGNAVPIPLAAAIGRQLLRAARA